LKVQGTETKVRPSEMFEFPSIRVIESQLYIFLTWLIIFLQSQHCTCHKIRTKKEQSFFLNYFLVKEREEEKKEEKERTRSRRIRIRRCEVTSQIPLTCMEEGL